MMKTMDEYEALIAIAEAEKALNLVLQPAHFAFLLNRLQGRHVILSSVRRSGKMTMQRVADYIYRTRQDV